MLRINRFILKFCQEPHQNLPQDMSAWHQREAWMNLWVLESKRAQVNGVLE